MLMAESFLNRYFRLHHDTVYLPGGNNLRDGVIHKKDAVAFAYQRQRHDRVEKGEGVFPALFAAGKHPNILLLALIFAVCGQAEPAG